MGARLSSFALAETQKAEMSQFHAPQFFFISQRTFAYSSVLCCGGSYDTFHEEMRKRSNAGPAHIQFISSSISWSFDFKAKSYNSKAICSSTFSSFVWSTCEQFLMRKKTKIDLKTFQQSLDVWKVNFHYGATMWRAFMNDTVLTEQETGLTVGWMRDDWSGRKHVSKIGCSGSEIFAFSEVRLGRAVHDSREVSLQISAGSHDFKKLKRRLVLQKENGP